MPWGGWILYVNISMKLLEICMKMPFITKEKKWLYSGKIWQTPPNQVITVNITNMGQISTLCLLMHWEEYTHLQGLPVSKMHTDMDRWETDKPKLRDIAQNNWPIFKNVNVMKVKERLRNYSRVKETKGHDPNKKSFFDIVNIEQ